MARSRPLLVPILGDQLSRDISSLDGVDRGEAVLLLMEVEEEATYVRHHQAKIAFLFSAMRHHAEDLRERGWTVDYVKLDDPDNRGSFSGEMARAIERHSSERIRVTEAGEWRVREMLENWEDRFGLPVEICSDTRFLCSHDEFEDWAEGRKSPTMEYFYREMRRKTGFLMEGMNRPAANGIMTRTIANRPNRICSYPSRSPFGPTRLPKRCWRWSPSISVIIPAISIISTSR